MYASSESLRLFEVLDYFEYLGITKDLEAFGVIYGPFDSLQ